MLSVNGLLLNVVYLPGREGREREGVSVGHIGGDTVDLRFEGEMVFGKRT